jgi:hypothetical protein
VITTPTGTPVFPPGRYGRRRAPRRARPRLVAVLVAAALLVGAVAVLPLYRKYGDPTYDAQVITYTGITDRSVDVTFRVTVPPGGSAICLVWPCPRDHATVGHEEVRVVAAPGERLVTTTHRLVTTGRPMIGEVLRCRAG